jgi:hypothetical membrane protein
MTSRLLVQARVQSSTDKVHRRLWLILGVVAIVLMAIGIFALLGTYWHTPGVSAEMGWYP